MGSRHRVCTILIHSWEHHVLRLMRDRYLLRADLEGFSYKDVLEVKPGSVRLLIGDQGRRRRWRLFVGLAVLTYSFGAGILLSQYGAALSALLTSMLGPLWGFVFSITIPGVGLAVIALWGDHYLPNYLARRPLHALQVEVLRSESYRFFQELRVRGGGQFMQVTVNGTRKRVTEALRLAATSPTGITD